MAQKKIKKKADKFDLELSTRFPCEVTMESFEKCECDVQDREGSVWLNIDPSSFWLLVLSEHQEPTHQ